MLLQIADILSPEECAAIADAIGHEDLWKDGRETAKGAARRVKNNLQGDASSVAVKGVLKKIEQALSDNPVFRAAAQPAGFARIMLNRYGQGMSYGEHVDAPYIDGKRSDISFTAFLSDPEDYEGGALVIDNAGHADEIRGARGSVVIYPSTAVHRVDEVTSGERLACIGWVNSRVRSAEHRAILFDLETAIASLNETGAPQAVRDRLANVRNNLLRAFGE